MSCQCEGNCFSHFCVNGEVHNTATINEMGGQAYFTNRGTNNFNQLIDYLRNIRNNGNYPEWEWSGLPKLIEMLSNRDPEIFFGGGDTRPPHNWGDFTWLLSYWVAVATGLQAGCECGEDDLPSDPEPNITFAPANTSPIILDLNGNGVETKSKENGVYFDHDGDGFAQKTGWVGADDALLVWDRNGNGLIDDGSELFGNNFILSNGKMAANGFEALKEFDANGDGIVDDGELLTLELIHPL